MFLLANNEGKAGIKKAVNILKKKGSVLDALEEGIKLVENDLNVDSVGVGGLPNILGEVECDAAIMNGDTREVGIIGALKDCKNTISVARKVMEKLPHIMLVGEGAKRFQKELNLRDFNNLTETIKKKYKEWLDIHLSNSEIANLSYNELAEHVWKSADRLSAGGTTIFLGSDFSNNLSAATSTSGWGFSYPGRLGDSPIVGGGFYADSRYGACGCTYTGEVTVRSCAAHSVVFFLKSGLSVEEAVFKTFEDIESLKKGYIGPVIIHAVDKAGNPCVMANYDFDSDIGYYYWRDKLKKPEKREIQVFK